MKTAETLSNTTFITDSLWLPLIPWLFVTITVMNFLIDGGGVSGQTTRDPA